jgi:Flp pilus assembly pilin Flp
MGPLDDKDKSISKHGAESLECTLVAGLVIVAAVAIVGSIGNKVLADWQSVNQSIDSRSVNVQPK